MRTLLILACLMLPGLSWAGSTSLSDTFVAPGVSDITDDLSCSANQVVARNAADTAFECADPSTGLGDVTWVGPGCTGGSCFTDGKTTEAGVKNILIWEGETDDLKEFILQMQVADPTDDVLIKFPSASGTLASKTGDSWSGVHNWQGNFNAGLSTNLELANGGDGCDGASAPDVTGEIHLDTTLSGHNGMWCYYDTDTLMVIPAIPFIDLGEDDNFIIKYNATADKFTLEADQGGSSDVSAVGAGCASGECLTDGVVTTGTSMFVWEGTTDDDADLNIIAPADPNDSGTDIDITLPTADGTLALATGDAFTGVHDFGEATSLEIPNDPNAIDDAKVDATGEISLDTTIDDHNGYLVYYDGSTLMAVPAIPAADIVATNDYIIKYDDVANKFTMEADAGSAPAEDSIETTELNDAADNPAAHDVIMTLTADPNQFAYATMPNCTDAGTEKLNYEAATQTFSCETDVSSGSGAFDNSSDPVPLLSTGKDVYIGAAHVNTSKLAVDGDLENSPALTVQGNATQTESTIIVEQSDGTEVVNVNDDGTILGQSISDIDGPGTLWSVDAAGLGDFAAVTMGGDPNNPMFSVDDPNNKLFIDTNTDGTANFTLTTSGLSILGNSSAGQALTLLEDTDYGAHSWKLAVADANLASDFTITPAVDGTLSAATLITADTVSRTQIDEALVSLQWHADDCTALTCDATAKGEPCFEVDATSLYVCDGGTWRNQNAAAATATHTICETIYAPATEVQLTDDIDSFWRAPANVTITDMWCQVDAGTISINYQLDDGTPADIDTVDLPCDTTGVNQVPDGDANVADGEFLDLVIVDTRSGAPTRLSFCAEYTYD